MLRRILRFLFAVPPKPPSARKSPVKRPSQRTPTPKSKQRSVPKGTPTNPLVGPCYVIDGDTISIRSVRIRLWGIDAPEMDHPWGKKSKWALVQLTRNQNIRAVFDGSASHDRAVAKCYLPDGTDLSAELVKQGLALDWPKFSGGAYAKLEPTGVRKKLWRADARMKGRYPPGSTH